MLKGINKTCVMVSVAFCVAMLFVASSASSADAPKVADGVPARNAAYRIIASDASLNDGILTYTMTSSAKALCSVSERAIKAGRSTASQVVVEISSADFVEKPARLPDNQFVSMETEDLVGLTAPGKRLIFTLDDSYGYDLVEGETSVQIIFAPALQNKEERGSSSTKALGKPKVIVQEFQVVATPQTTTVSLVADGKIEDYTVDTQESPGTAPNMYIDIKGVDFSSLTREKIIGSRSLSRVRVVPKSRSSVRLIFEATGSRLFKYKINQTRTGLDVVIDEEAALRNSGSLEQLVKDSNKEKKSADTLDKLLGSAQGLATAKNSELLNGATQQGRGAGGDFGSSDYNGVQRITVDFYKIDVHNVFRLFREITNLNIIVHKGCQGALTLALNDVPWDFALDIILNLMDFKQERRFNTIVIYPAGKEFVWPERADDNLAISPNLQIMQEQDALVIEKTASQPKEVLQAKELLAQAQVLEKQENFEDALVLYDKAHNLWLKNTKISDHVAMLCLVELRQNAKALHYATSSLKYKPSDYRAALYAAIASANMKQLSQANEYFKRAISGAPPVKEALLSYAAFSENHGKNQAALKLLAKYKQNYGDDAATMLARARIYDKDGQEIEATKEYRALLNSGYQLPADLRRYIQYRIAGGQ